MAVHNVKGNSGVVPGAASAAPAAAKEAAKSEKTVKASATAAAAYAKSAPRVDNAAAVNISDEAKALNMRAQEMKKAHEIVSATPDVDEAKVEKYKDMLAKGYKPNPAKIADGMARKALEDNDHVRQAVVDNYEHHT